MKHIELRPEDYLPAAPSREVRERYGIAVVGCGGIARGVHLPAYRKYGFRVTAVCDVVEELAREAAREFGVGFWTTRLEEVLERRDVDVIDLAVTPEVRLSLVEQIAPSGKAILSQKPLAPTLAEAERIVEVCAEAGVTLMVNQQARWAPAHKAIKVLLDRGVLGHLYSVVHVHRQYQDQPGIKWLSFPDATIVENGIHYVDLSRYFTGRTPERGHSRHGDGPRPERGLAHDLHDAAGVRARGAADVHAALQQHRAGEAAAPLPLVPGWHGGVDAALARRRADPRAH